MTAYFFNGSMNNFAGLCIKNDRWVLELLGVGLFAGFVARSQRLAVNVVFVIYDCRDRRPEARCRKL